MPTLVRRGPAVALPVPTPYTEKMCHLAINKDQVYKDMWRMIAAIVICGIFMVGEVVGGVFAHSLAIMTDAAHMLSDVSAFAISLFAGLYALRQSQTSHTYGYHRAEVLGSLVSILIIWIVTAVLIYEAIQRVIHPEDVDGKLMFILAVIGILVNLGVMAIFGHPGHNHGPGGCGGHGHSHGGGEDHAHEHDDEHGHTHGHGCGGGAGHDHGSHGHHAAVAAAPTAPISSSSCGGGGHAPIHGHQHSHGHSDSQPIATAAGLPAVGHVHSAACSHDHGHTHEQSHETSGRHEHEHNDKHVHSSSCSHGAADDNVAAPATVVTVPVPVAPARAHKHGHGHGPADAHGRAHLHAEGTSLGLALAGSVTIDLPTLVRSSLSGSSPPAAMSIHHSASSDGRAVLGIGGSPMQPTLSRGVSQSGSATAAQQPHAHAHTASISGDGGGGAAHTHGQSCHSHDHDDDPEHADETSHLHGHHHDHHHDHDHDGGGHGHDHASLGMKAAFIHALGDTVQSLGVCIAGIIIWVRPDLRIVDPICTFVFGFLVLLTTRGVLRDITDIIMERVPRHVDIDMLFARLKAVRGVDQIHDLHVWCLKPGVVLMSVHVVLKDGADHNTVLQRLTKTGKGAGINHSTIMVVQAGDNCPCDPLKVPLLAAEV